MEKIKKYISKHDKTAFLLISLICMIGIPLNMSISTGDEIWVFQNIYKLFQGFTIYVDANIITTPLYYNIGTLFFKILGANILTQRIYGITINLVLAFITYLILKRLKLNKKKSFICALILGMYININGVIVYNDMALVFVLFGVYNILNYENKKIIDNIIQGIIISLISLTKQNIGFFYIIGLFIYQIIIKKTRDVKAFIIEAVVSSIIIGSFLLILQKNGILYNFIDYAFLGLSSFATHNIGLNITQIITAIFFLGMNIALTYIFNKEKKIKNILSKRELTNIQILTTFSTPMLFYAYPIFNIAHTKMAIYLSIMEIIYIIFGIILKEFFKNSKLTKTLIIAPIIVLSAFSIANVISWLNGIYNNNYQYKYNDIFYGGIIKEEEYIEDQKIIKYIKENPKKVIVFGIDAARYMPELNRSNGDFDLPLIGNLGSKGEDGLIEKIKEQKDSVFLLKQQEELFWQESKKAVDFIKNNFEKIGEIESFEIYYNK